MPTANQRRLILLGGLAAVAAGWRVVPKIYDRLSDEFEFEVVQDPSGFRALRKGEVSGRIDPFAGIGDDNRGNLEPVVKRVRADLLKYLYGANASPNHVQLAYFSDFYCPYCRVLSGQVMEIADEGGIDVTWHETPIFGPASILAARGAIAAGRQGAYAEYHERLNRTPVQVSVSFLLSLAEQLGLDVNQFEADMQSSLTQSRLDDAAALSAIFGFIGTPAMVVGRTIVQGKISPTNLRQLINRERADGHIG
jgi:protein-disulfide isomerase